MSPMISIRSSRADSWATKHQEPLPTSPLSNWKHALRVSSAGYSLHGCSCTASFEDTSEDFLQQVYLVGRKVIEVSSAGNVRLHAPRQVFLVMVEVAGRLGEADLNVDDVANMSLLYQ